VLSLGIDYMAIVKKGERDFIHPERIAELCTIWRKILIVLLISSCIANLCLVGSGPFRVRSNQ
jgi:hypothetical protein